MSNVPLPQPDAYEYLIANVWRTQTHFNGVKAKDHRCLYATEKVHAHAAAVTAAKDARIKVLEDALRLALAELDELPAWSNAGYVCNIARAALEKAP